MFDKKIIVMILYRVMDYIENDEMCGFWSSISKYWVFTIVILYREVKCVEKDEMCGF